MENIKNIKILIINGQSLYKNNATGITLESIFLDWPNENIFELYLWENFNSRNTKFKIKSMLIPKDIFPLMYVFNNIKRGKQNRLNSNNQPNKINYGVKIFNDIKFTIKFFLEYFINLKRSHKMLKDIEEFNPNIIYTLGNSIQAMRLSLKLSEIYKLPIVVHYMDNWRETIMNQGFLSFYINKKKTKLIESLEKRMNVGLTISSLMASEYKLKYKKNYKVIMNSPLIINLINSNIKIENENKKIIYAGGLHLERYKSLLEIEKVVCKLNEKGYSFQIEIYTNIDDLNNYSSLFNKNTTMFYSYVDQNKLFEIYKTAMFFAHVESFEQSIIKYTKYSISTKIPEYMIFGRPILCYAPSEIAVSKYIKDHSIGVCNDNLNDLELSILKLINNEKYYNQCCKNCIKYANKNHSREELNKTLREVIEINVNNEVSSLN